MNLLRVDRQSTPFGSMAQGIRGALPAGWDALVDLTKLGRLPLYGRLRLVQRALQRGDPCVDLGLDLCGPVVDTFGHEPLGGTATEERGAEYC